MAVPVAPSVIKAEILKRLKVVVIQDGFISSDAKADFINNYDAAIPFARAKRSIANELIGRNEDRSGFESALDQLEKIEKLVESKAEQLSRKTFRDKEADDAANELMNSNSELFRIVVPLSDSVHRQ